MIQKLLNTTLQSKVETHCEKQVFTYKHPELFMPQTFIKAKQTALVVENVS